MGNNILKGLRVLDFTWVLAGPYATRILADFGAEVIKVQTLGKGRGSESNLSPYFAHWNRNKLSITINMSHPEAQALVFRLVKMSDVAIENFSPRVMPNWGLGYERLSEVNAGLIMLSMSAMGQTGPWKDFVAFGPSLQSIGGLTFLTSFSEDSPLGVGFAYADIIAGLYGALAVLSALEYRNRTGKGQYIDLSQYEAICTTIGPALMDVFARKDEWFPRGNDSNDLQAAPYGCYKCSGKERWCVIAVFSEDEWRAFCEAVGNPAWTKKERFSTLQKRKSHKEDLDKCVQDWTIKQTAEKLVELLQEAGVSAGVVQNAEDLANDPHLLERAFYTKLTHPFLGELCTDTYPFQFEEQAVRRWKSSPLIGEDNHYVFSELLGLPEDEINAYIAKGIIA